MNLPNQGYIANLPGILVRQSVDGLSAELKTVIVMGSTPKDLYALDMRAPGQGVSRYEGLGSLAERRIAALWDSLKGLFAPVVLWKTPFAAGYSLPVEMNPLVGLFISVFGLGMLAVSFAGGRHRHDGSAHG